MLGLQDNQHNEVLEKNRDDLGSIQNEIGPGTNDKMSKERRYNEGKSSPRWWGQNNIFQRYWSGGINCKHAVLKKNVATSKNSLGSMSEIESVHFR